MGLVRKPAIISRSLLIPAGDIRGKKARLAAVLKTITDRSRSARCAVPGEKGMGPAKKGT